MQPTPRRANVGDPAEAKDMMPLLKLLIAGLFAACDPASPDPDSWSTAADCAGLDDAAWRDECYAKIAVTTASTDRAAGSALVEMIQDPLVRDYAWLTITREVDPGTPELCRRIVQKEIRDRCEMLVRRPHLHRELNPPQVVEDEGG